MIQAALQLALLAAGLLVPPPLGAWAFSQMVLLLLLVLLLGLPAAVVGLRPALVLGLSIGLAVLVLLVVAVLSV